MVSLKLKIIGLCLILICFSTVRVFAGSDGKKGFMMEGINPVTIEVNQTFITSVEIFPFDKEVSKIYGLAVSGNVTLNNDNSVVRVILLDQKFNEYLVYEAYSLLEDNLSFSVVNSSEETSLLDGINPYLVRIEVTDASILLNSLSYASGVPAGTDFQKVKKEKKAAQSQEKINKINQSLKKKGKHWFAGKTSVSELTYAERKKLYGQSNIPPGMEFYSGGIIEVGSNPTSLAEASSYVEGWDWRNRHGQNWITSIKNQGNCGSCWAFAATGSTEALVNLYFNKHLDLNLSEQDVLSCSGAGSCSGGWPYIALDYIKNTGIVDEATFPYTASNQRCSNKGSSPSELIKIGGRIDIGTSSFPRTEDGLKKTLIEKGPICGGIYDWSHSMVLVGYKVVEAGDQFFYGNGSKLYDAYWVTISEGDPLIGKTVWFFKNSWGNWGDGGYGYFEMDVSNFGWTHALKTPVQSLIAPQEVQCVDNDHDGYCWWGIGPKPASCPVGCPDLADGDDSNSKFGPLDEYGHLTDISGNNPPVFDPDPIDKENATEDAAYTNSLTNDATDADGDALTFSKLSGPAWLTVDSDGSLSGTPAAADIGANSWTVQVSDGNGGTDTATLNITVDAASNQAPSFTVDPINEIDATEDAAYSSTLEDHASDPGSNAMTFSKVSGPAWLTVASDGTLSGTPSNGDVGANTFTVQVDATGGYDTATLNITVINTNDDPTFTVDPITGSYAVDGSLYSGSIAGTATDIDAGDTLTYSKVSGPPWLAVASDGTLSGTPGESDIGPNTWIVRVEDLAKAYDEAVLQIMVNETPPDVDYVASGETTAEGTLTSDYRNTHHSDNVYEAVTEYVKARKWSTLDHTWTFNITGNNTVMFMVEAYHTANNEGDDFIFAYSTDNVVFTDMFTVTKTSDSDTSQSYELPSNTTGTIYIRVTDTDNTRNSTSLDTLYVDHMIIRTSGGQTAPGAAHSPSPENGEVNAAVGTILYWASGAGAEWHDVYLGTQSGNLFSVSTNQPDTSYEPESLAEATTYYWRIDEGNEAGTTRGAEWSFTTTGGACSPSSVQVVSMVTDTIRGSAGQSYGQATVTLQDDCGDPVSGAVVTGHFTGDFSDEPLTAASDANGQAVFTTAKEIKKPVFGFIVDSVSKEYLTWIQ